jgi:hypothetical protein
VSDRALVGVVTCSEPARVAAELAHALAALLCRGRHDGAGGPCADCAASGEVLAPVVGEALFGLRRVASDGVRVRNLTTGDYELVGRALEELEQAAGLRPGPARRAPGWPRRARRV